jgi:hypothetical protein
MYCSYYQAHVVPVTGWFVVAALKSYEHMLFDRTLDVEKSIFEFFVVPAAEPTFLQLMDYMREHGYVTNIEKLPNRLIDSDQV